MEFTCRPSPSHKTWLHRLNGQNLELLNDKGEVKQTVELGSICRIQQYDAVATTDPETGPYHSEYCQIVPAQGWSVYLRNGSYVRPSGKIGEFVTNQNDEYVEFLTELKRRVAKQNPNVPVIYGWLMAALAWWGLVPIGIAFLASAVGLFIMDEFLTALGLAAFFIPLGLVFVVGGPAIGRTYWPRRTTVAKDLKTLDVARSAPMETFEVTT